MEAKAATCVRCGCLVPLGVASCPTCGAAQAVHIADEGPLTEGAPPPDTGGERADDARYAAGQKLLGHYVIVRQLGRGGMGTVYLARDEVSGQEVAVKVLPGALARERDIRERFVQEARALASMDHPNIVPLVTFAQENDDRFLVMKYIPGEALDARIRRVGVLPPEDARKILRALLAALGYAHARGVVHRDVKPSNVIIEGDITGEHRIFLVDFGIAKKEESKDKLTQTGMLMGTPQYMSPEQISGHTVDGRSDLYAAGLVLFEMLCGRPPFDGQKTFQVLRAHVEQPVPDLEETRGSAIPEDLVKLAHVLLAKDPAYRPADATAAIELVDGTGSYPIAPATAAPVTHLTPATAQVRRPSLAPERAAPAMFSTPFADSFESDGQLEDPSFDEIRALGARRRTTLFSALFLGAAALGALWVVRQDLNFDFAAPAHARDAGVSIGDDDAVKASMLFSKGRLALEKRDLDNARILAEAGLELAPNDADGHLLRAAVLIEGDAFDEADKELAKLRALTGLAADEVAATTALEERAQARRQAGAQAREALERERRDRDRAARERGAPPSKLSSASLTAVTSTAASAMRSCYEDEVLKKYPRAEGEVIITAQVAPSGRVESVSLKVPAKLQRGAFVTCVKGAAQKWKFPAWQGRAESYPHKIYFRPG